MTPTDRIRTRTVRNQLSLVQEHLEAMQRDSHGLEYGPWKQEADAIWKQVFEQIGRMSPDPQQASLSMIRDVWTTYLTHYAVATE